MTSSPHARAIEAMMLSNDTTRKYQFDNRGQLTTQIEMSGATNVFTTVDGYDPVGNRVTRNFDGNPITWTYDDLYRLTGQQKAGQVCTYTLDGVGNLKTMWEGGKFPKTFTWGAADRLVTMVEGASLTTYAWTGYGALGSEITGNSSTGYAYNGQDQLVVVTEPSGDKTTYSFDGDGLRRSVATTNVSQDPPTLDVTTMVWDGSDYLLLNEPTQNRVVLTLDSEIVSCGSKDLLTDPLGSLVKEISTGASLGSLVELYPYGTRASALTKISIPFVYIAAYGYYTDSAERDYVRARELYKTLGRWMQTDPIWPGDDAYAYSASIPTSLIDPTGARPTYIDCPKPVQDWLDKICKNLSNLDSRGAAAVDACIQKQAARHGHKCPPFSGSVQQCMMKFCKGGRVRCYPRDIPGWPGVSGVNIGPNDCKQSLSNVGSPYFDIFQDWSVNVDGDVIRLDWLALSFIHEMGHACGVQHGYGMPPGVGPPVDRQCNDYLAFCLYNTFWNKK